jgi:uncharacterized protein YaiE (UPF0345 family)
MKRTILNEVLSRKPELPLYHYTGQSGLLGIIGKKEIWATHTQYLNDRREYLHALDVVREEIDKLLVSSAQESRIIFEEMKNGISGIERMNVCVCSFSEDRDSLSQWRAYSSGPSGFAVGFSGDFLAEVAEDKHWYLAPCIYEPDQQRALIRALVEEVFEQNVERRDTNEAELVHLPLGGSLCAYLHRYAPLLKDYSFRGEKEWRVISRPLFCEHDLFDFREGNSMLIPYYRLPLIDKKQNFRVHEVVVGPTPNEQQSQRSVKSFLVRHGYEKVPVELSSVQYRNW